MYIDDPVAASTAGCFSGILRRIVCGTHRDLNSRRVVADTGSPNPGVVACLMGLESMPAAGPSDASGSIRRTRSANSADGWNGFLSGHANWAAKGSRSFREPPTFLREDDADFFVLSFVVAGDKKCHGEFDKGKNVEMAATAKKGSRCVNRKLADSECSSQDSSPVSVLDRRTDTDAEYVMGLASPVSEGGGEGEVKKAEKEKVRPKQPSPQVADKKKKKKKKSSKCTSPKAKAEAKAEAADVIYSTKETKNLRSAPVSSSSSTAAVENKERSAAAKCSERRGEGTAPLLLLPGVQKHSCQLADDDVSRSSWRTPWEFSAGEDVGVAVELEIMEFLVYETVAELSFQCTASRP